MQAFKKGRLEKHRTPSWIHLKLTYTKPTLITCEKLVTNKKWRDVEKKQQTFGLLANVRKQAWSHLGKSVKNEKALDLEKLRLARNVDKHRETTE